MIETITMKRLHAFFALLIMLLFISNRASALSTTVEWEIPGSVMLKVDSSSGPYIDLSADQTSYIYTTSEAYGYIYIYAADGYSLIDAVTTDGSNRYTPNTWASSQYISVYVGQGNGMDGKTVKVNCIKIERNDQFTFDVVNGIDFFQATFASGHVLNLAQGENVCDFNPQIDGDLTLKLDGISSVYSFTNNGEPVEKDYGPTYTTTITPGCNLSLQVFESDADIPVDCRLTLVYAPGLESCLYSISNRTTNSIYVPGDLVDNSIIFKGGNEIRVNLIDDFSYTKFTLDGADITDNFNAYQNYVSFILPNAATATLVIDGTPKEYSNIEFTGYISGAEGVEFSLTYNGAAIEIPEGESITEDIEVGSYTLTPDNAKKYVIPVSEKIGKIFFRPKAGYFIAELFSLVDDKMERHGASSSIYPASDGTEFYMVVKKFDEPYTFNLTTTGSAYTARMSTENSSITNSWHNPEGLHISLSEGSSSVSFITNYDIPAVISVYGNETMDPAAYLDGAPLAPYVNSDSGAKEFTFSPYFPTENDDIAEGVTSDVQVYLSKDRPSLSGASLIVEDGLLADFFYSPVRHAADPEGQTVISGTLMIVRPADKNAVVTFRDERVELDENGEFVFEAKGNPRNNVVTVSSEAGIEGVLTDKDGNVTIYTLDGRKLLDNSPASLLPRLPKGLYIINGKKTILQ